MSVNSEPGVLPADPIVAGFRLSPQQRRLWSLGGGDAVSPYRASCAVRIKGTLDVAALGSAVRGAVERHEILRTTFRSLEEVRVPLQVVGDHPPRLAPRVDLAQAADLDALHEEMRRLPIDVGRGPLVHCRLAAVGPEEWVLLIAHPALCGDAAGLRGLVREIAAGYAAAGGAAIGEQPLQYADLSEWQNGLLAAAEAEHWRRQAPASPPRLPCELAASGRFAPRAHPVPLGTGVDTAIDELARRHGATARAFLLACWQIALARLSSQRELLLGVADDGRSYAGLERALGPFAKHLPLVCRWDPGVPFGELWRRCEADLAELRQWQEYYDPEQGSPPEGEPAYLPVGFACEEELPPLAAAGVTFVAPRVEACIDRFHLALVGRRSGSLGVELCYDERRFRRRDVARLGDQLRTLIGSALAAPLSPVAALSLLDDAERHRLVVELNRTEAARPPVRGVHEIFARRLESVAGRPALRCEDRVLTHGELSGRANQLAHRLRRLGVGPEVPVAICCERSLEAVVAILGVLKAGGAYVPLDPGQPAARLGAMLEEVGAPVLLSQQRLAGALPAHGARVVWLDADWSDVAGESDRDPPPLGEPENLAYVIFTSGSTGRPKGVGVEHRQLLNYVAGAIAALDLPAEASFATVSTFAADLGHTMIFPSLCSGGCLHVVTQERLVDPAAAADYFARFPVDCLKIVPSHLAALLSHRDPGRLLPRRRLVLGGEPCRRSLVETIQGLAPACELFNHYGPTETTVGVLVHRVASDGAAVDAPLGRPLGNIRVYLLDGDHRPVPVWVPGEIYVGGAGVARGYVGQPGQTAERFVPDPFAEGSRLYRTGDLARFLPGGEVEFLGRADDQIKIRGFRIEPGEIEAQLRAHPAVAQALVLGREDGGGELRLVAYVVLRDASKQVAPELRGWLAERLPEPMVPAAFVALDALPLGPNGKVDRAALPAPKATDAAAYEPPRGPLAELLAGIWAAVLARDRVGVHDDFFAIGGHSLLATQVISRVRHALGREVPLRLLFESPTLARFATRVEELASGAGVALPPVEPVPRGGDLPLSFAQQRLWFLEQLEPGSPVYHIPAAFRLSGVLDVAALARSLAEIVRRHEALRTTFPALQGRPVQKIEPPAATALPLVVDLAALPRARREAEALRIATVEARRPFDLVRGPLYRTALLRLAGREHALLATLHHIVGDGWSRGILARELGALYPAYAAGRPSPLPELPIQYADFAHWQRRWLEGEVLDSQLEYWRRQLAGAPPVLTLPSDRPRSAASQHAGDHLQFRLPSVVSSGLRHLSQSAGTTLFMTLLAGFQILLCRLSGQQDVCVGTPIAGRHRLEIEGLIGFFVNTLVLRGDLTGGPAFGELQSRVRGVVLEAYARQDLPFERLVEELDPERSLGLNPLFQVMLALHNAPPERLELPGLTLSALAVATEASKFDLAMPLLETAEGLAGALEYDTGLFDEATVLRWLRTFETLLAAVVERPETPLWDLPLLAAAERHQLLVEWQPAPAFDASRTGLHELFEAQAARTPERMAVVLGDGGLTYAELDARANRLARRLATLGVGPERVAAVIAERSPATLVALLAVLKAGGAYLPVAPELPAERIAFLLQDSRAAAVLTGIDADVDADGPCDALGLPVAPGQLAYVIYTSGSTGQPKGVGVSHAAAAAHLAAIPEAFGLDPADRILQFSSLSFDVSLEQIFSALLLGATLVMRGEETWGEAELGQQIRQQGVTVANLPTAYWHQVAQPGLIAGLRGGPLRLMIAGGEAMLPAASELWLQGPARLLNAYGPTEATITATLCPVTADLSRAARVPIGRPLGERTVQVRDAWGALVPIGVPGELFLGGPLLARGYLNHPQLTAERFVPDPLGAPGSRLYRTGDLVRVLADGALEFLGRADFQVKIRGFRVELGEIEAAIARHPRVDGCAVLAVASADAGDLRLVAYAVPRPGEALATSDLRRHLERELPDYLRPAAFVLLDALPLTPTGKLDRRALPPWEPARLAPPSADAAANPLEEIVAAVWSQVLRREEIGPRDNFFDLGGHSLLAVQVVSRLREAFAVELPLRSLFEAPTVAGLATAIDELRQAGEAPVPRIEPVSRDGPLPLSFAQERLWFLHQLQPDSAAYHMRLAFRLAGALDRAALEGSLGEILRRHEVLRTTFGGAARGEPVQVIAPPGPASLAVCDLSGLPARERELAAGRLLREASGRPFDLASGPPLRLGLARLAADDHLVLAVFHHLVADGWAVGVLLRELAALYAALAAGRPSPLPELPVQYADYAAWQRRWLAGEALEALSVYWRRQLAGMAPLELPLDRPRPQTQTFRGRRELLRLPPRLRDACLLLGRREAATLFMTLLAAFAALLSRYTGSEDVPLGTPVANRDRPELEGLVGLFLNTLVMRADLARDPSAAELLRRVRETALQAFAHQQLPFEKVVEELQPERDPSRTPLFQVMFVLQTAPEGALELPGLRARPIGLPEEAAKLDLTLTMRRSHDGLVGAFYYRQDLFDAATIRRLGRHLETLLEGMAAAPERPLSRLSLLSDAERHQAVLEWGDARPVALPEPCLHRRFAAQAARTPDAVAVHLGAAGLTYRELSERACRLAHRLIALGVRPGDLVGLCLPRSLEMVVAILGVLEAGGGYLPLDPDYPRERLAFALEDSRVAVVITQEELAAALPATGVRRLRLDAERAEIDAESAASPGVPAAAELPAYVIYTSGSTGRPKGVVVTHANVCRLFESTEPWFGFGAADVWTLFHSYAFDFSVWELWGALLHGGRLVVVPYGISRSPEAFYDLLREEGVTVLNQTPSAFRQLLWAESSTLAAAGPPAPELTLRWVVFGGEALELASLVPWFARHGDERPRLVNMYGITETTVHVTYRPLRQQDAEEARASLIGRALPDLALRVLDRDLAPLPIGVPGEIHVGGAGVALGYLDRPELTAARFVPDPFGAPGARLYRSGDLARYLPDGDLECLGRSDDQVKIRGFRIELGEIEDVLARQPGVRQVAVAAVGDRAGGRRLAAYVVPQPGESVSFSELRAAARARLPEVMVPSTFTLLDSFRLTPSGKLDRRALPDPLPETAAEAVPPRNVLEELIASLWSAVLGRENVGASDDFFALGGHSLTAAQVVARLRQALGREVALGLLFQHPTVAGLAAALETAEREAAAISTPPITRAARDGELPLSSAQVRLWFLEHFAPGTAVLNIPRALRFHGRLALPALAGALTEIVRRHEVLRTAFPDAQGRPIQAIGLPRPCLLPLVDLSALPAERREPEAAELTAAEARRPFDLARGPLLRTTVLRLGEDDHSVLSTMHHIVSDGWSTGILVRELSAVYRALLAGRPSPLQELPIQYADYAVWQARGLAAGAFDAHLAYWRQRLAGAAPLLLPADRPRPPVRSSRGATRGVDLGQPLGLAVAALSRQEDATLFMTLLAAFQAVLGRLAGQDDIVVGTDYANRDRLETEGLIGFFVNQLVLRADLGDNPSFRELLARVRRSALAAYAHRNLPFERLVEALNPRRGLDAAPLFQVKLILQNAPAAGLDLPGVTLRPVATQPGAAQLDLTLAFAQSARGLTGWINYSTDLFDAATVDRLVRQLADLLAQVVRDPEARLDELARNLNAMERKQLMTESTRREANFQRFKAAQPKPVSLPARDVVRMAPLTPGQRLPLLVTPAVEDVDLAAWLASHRDLIESKLREHGAILFRGFGIASPESFERFALTLCSQLFHDNGEHPRESVSGNVYTPVFYPADQRLLWHNENSFNFQWPAKILFCCVQPPATGGETPIVDSREVFAALPDALRERFLAAQVMYVRNFGGGLGLDWRTVFQVADQAALEEHCRAHRIEVEWRDGDRLHTRSVRPAAIRHPATGEMSWFNQAQHWHLSCLDPETRRSLESLFGEEDLPRNCYLGDGSRIADPDMAEILAAYRRLEVSFPWQRGDVLLVDNVLTAHGRNPFTGERKLLVAMGEMTSFEEVSA